ncbi:MAG: hypothetical protein AAFN70_14380, partial [Planctomycetota bacterium]
RFAPSGRIKRVDGAIVANPNIRPHLDPGVVLEISKVGRDDRNGKIREARIQDVLPSPGCKRSDASAVQATMYGRLHFWLR